MAENPILYHGTNSKGNIYINLRGYQVVSLDRKWTTIGREKIDAYKLKNSLKSGFLKIL